MTILRPFFSYYGGKWRATPLYPTPEYERLVEPFAGGAGFSLRHHEHAVELYEVDPVVASVWRYLIGVSEAEVLALPIGFEHVDELSVSQEAKWLIGFWLNKASVAPRKSPSAWMRAGAGGATQYWGPQVRDRIARQLRFIRHWKVLEAPFNHAPGGAATWFVDPPYQAKCGRLYTYSDIDYALLGEWCHGLEGQAIVCEKEGADWLPFKPLAEIQTTNGRWGGKTSREVVWLGKIL